MPFLVRPKMFLFFSMFLGGGGNGCFQLPLLVIAVKRLIPPRGSACYLFDHRVFVQTVLYQTVYKSQWTFILLCVSPTFIPLVLELNNLLR